MKAVLYVRVSSQEQQEDGYSLQAQEKEAKEYAQKKNIDIVKIWAVSESAKSEGRVDFGEMLDFMKTNKDISIILIEKPDRMTRNLADLVKIYEIIEKYSKEIHFFKQGLILDKNSKSQEKFMLDVQVVLARQYVNNLSEETKKGLLQKAEQGEFPTKAPFGYINNKQTHKIEQNDLSSAVVKRMFELYSTGNYSLEALKLKLESEGFRNQSSKTFHKSQIEAILKNTIYYGIFYWKGKICKGTHEPIISKELFDLVQKQLHRFNRPHISKHNFPYSGLLVCGHCGSSITAEIRKGKYIYYHCTYHKGQCGNGYIRQDRLEEKLGAILKNIYIDDEKLVLLKDTLKNSFEHEKNYRDNEIQALKLRYDKLKTKLDRLYEDKLEGHITSDFWLLKYNEYKAEQEKIKQLLGKHEQGNYDYMDSGIRILEIANKAFELWKVRKPYEKRELLNSVVSNCTLSLENSEPTVVPAYQKPFDLMLNLNSCPNMGG